MHDPLTKSRSFSFDIILYLQVGIVGPLGSVSGPADAEAAALEKGKLVELTKLLNSVCSAIGGQLEEFDKQNVVKSLHGFVLFCVLIFSLCKHQS